MKKKDYQKTGEQPELLQGKYITTTVSQSEDQKAVIILL